MRDRERREPEDIVYGRWPVREALEAGAVAKILIAHGVNGDPIDAITRLAKEKKIPYLWVDRRKLDQMAGENHQGVLAHVAPFRAADPEQVWHAVAGHQGNGPCALFLDGILDPQNLGSILRSAVFFGVSGVFIPKWRASPLTSTVVRASAGAARRIPIAQVANLATAMEVARDKGIWLIGADMDGKDAKTVDLPRPFALVMGSEGEGLHQLVKKKCDLTVRIAGRPHPGVASLNVSVACAVLLHQFTGGK